jgi:hypothetical protein
MYKMALTNKVSENDNSCFSVWSGAKRPITHTWLSGYQRPGAQPTTPAMGVSPPKLEVVRTSESESVKKIFFMIILLYLVELRAEIAKTARHRHHFNKNSCYLI